MRVRFSIPNVENFSAQIKAAVVERASSIVKKALMPLAIDLKEDMAKGAEKTRRKPNDGTLAGAIRKSKISIYMSKGDMIVSIIRHSDMLKAGAPYWYVANYGTLFGTNIKYIPPSIPGQFNDRSRPNSSNINGSTRFNPSSNGPDLIQPLRAVRPLHYIEGAFSKLGNKLRRKIKEVSKGRA